MAAFLKLATIFLALIISQIASGQEIQEYDDYEQKDESDISYLKKLLDSLTVLSVRPQWISSDSSEAFDIERDSSGFDDGYDDDRQSRSHGTHDMEEHFCQVIKREHKLTDPDNFEYRPSSLIEKDCKPVIIERVNHNQKEMCYVRGTGCQTIIQEVTIFKRPRRAGNCWVPEVRNISSGCRCYLERQSLHRKYYG